MRQMIKSIYAADGLTIFALGLPYLVQNEPTLTETA